MAQTFKINNGDVVMNDSNGRPKLIGNPIGEEDIPQSEAKSKQDIRGALSINKIRSGAGAGIAELVGFTNDLGIGSVSMFLTKRIRDTVASIIRLQRRRFDTRPPSERFSKISFLRVFPDRSIKTKFNFRLDVKTSRNETIVQSGAIGTGNDAS